MLPGGISALPLAGGLVADLGATVLPTPSTSTLSRPRCKPPLRRGERQNAEMLVYTGKRYSGRGLNPHVHNGTTDFESAASAVPPPERSAGREDRTHLGQLVELVPSPEDESRENHTDGREAVFLNGRPRRN